MKEFSKKKDEMINDQNTLPGGFGALGTMKDNGCGVVALYNVEVILENKDFSLEQAYNIVTKNSKGPILLGLLETDPRIMEPYFDSQGYNSKWVSDINNISKDADVYIILTIWYVEGKLGAHFQAAYYNEIGALTTTNYKKTYKDFNDFYENDGGIVGMDVLEIRKK